MRTKRYNWIRLVFDSKTQTDFSGDTYIGRQYNDNITYLFYLFYRYWSFIEHTSLQCSRLQAKINITVQFLRNQKSTINPNTYGSFKTTHAVNGSPSSSRITLYAYGHHPLYYREEHEDQQTYHQINTNDHHTITENTIILLYASLLHRGAQDTLTIWRVDNSINWNEQQNFLWLLLVLQKWTGWRRRNDLHLQRRNRCLPCFVCWSTRRKKRHDNSVELTWGNETPEEDYLFIEGITKPIKSLLMKCTVLSKTLLNTLNRYLILEKSCISWIPIVLLTPK